MKSIRADGVGTYDLLCNHALDISGAEHVEVSVRGDNKVLWVNVNGVCVLRICQIEELHRGAGMNYDVPNIKKVTL